MYDDREWIWVSMMIFSSTHKFKKILRDHKLAAALWKWNANVHNYNFYTHSHKIYKMTRLFSNAIDVRLCLLQQIKSFEVRGAKKPMDIMHLAIWNIPAQFYVGST